jgi:hypothetical protein
MARAGDGEQFVSRGDELQCGRQLVDGAEAIVRTVNEERGSFEIREMRGAQFRGPSRWMKRIGEQEKSVCESRLSGAEYGGLPASVGMAAEKDAA